MFADFYRRAGYHIWSDIELNPNYFPNYINLDWPIELEEGELFESGWDYLQKCAVTGQSFPYSNIYILLDEWQYHSDSRMSRDIANIVYSYLFVQSRKRGLVICMTSKTSGMIDTRHRDDDMTIKCEKRHFYNNKKCFDHECDLPHYFKWLIVDRQNRIGKEIRINNLNPIFPMYDTNQLNAPVNDIDAKEIRKMISDLNVGGKV